MSSNWFTDLFSCCFPEKPPSYILSNSRRHGDDIELALQQNSHNSTINRNEPETTSIDVSLQQKIDFFTLDDNSSSSSSSTCTFDEDKIFKAGENEYKNDLRYDFYGVYIDDDSKKARKKKGYDKTRHETALSFVENANDFEETLNAMENEYGEEDEEGDDDDDDDTFSEYSKDVGITKEDVIYKIIENLERAIYFCNDLYRPSFILKYETAKEKYLSDNDMIFKKERDSVLEDARLKTTYKEKKKGFINALKMSYTLQTMRAIKEEWIMVSVLTPHL